MHAVNIGIGGNNNLVIAQRVKSVFDVQRFLQEVELFILVDHFLCQSIRVKGLSAK